MERGRHWGGSGRWVEGERVFAPPAGAFDPDWVAGIVLDRDPGAGERVALARAAQRARDARTRGAGDEEALAELTAAGLEPALAAAVLRATDDFATAYGL
ncbi:hypothetical protein [Kineococcus gypseus]|uniref:hypothetical protein n=1 Tax=Kineococcus gypseus TaxID=1637102 RepID=UPI003D7CBC17